MSGFRDAAMGSLFAAVVFAVMAGLAGLAGWEGTSLILMATALGLWLVVTLGAIAHAWWLL